MKTVELLNSWPKGKIILIIAVLFALWAIWPSGKNKPKADGADMCVSARQTMPQVSDNQTLQTAKVPCSKANEDEASEIIKRLVNEPLDGFAYTRRSPTSGEIWRLSTPSMRVIQVLSGGVRVETQRSAIDPSLPQKTFFVKTTRQYADGDVLIPGFYKSEGTKRFESTNGADVTLYVFSELPQSLQKEVGELIARINETQHREEEAKLALAEQKEAAERINPPTEEKFILFAGLHSRSAQCSNNIGSLFKSHIWAIFNETCKARIQKISESVSDSAYEETIVAYFVHWLFDNKCTTNRILLDRTLPALNFDSFKSNLVLQKSIREKFNIKYDHAFIEKLKELQKNRDWVGLLNVAFRGTQLKLKEIPDDLSAWTLCSDGITKLANLIVKVSIEPKDASVPEIRRVTFDDFSVNQEYGPMKGVPCGKNKVFFSKTDKVSIGSLNELAANYKKRARVIYDEYKLSMEPDANERNRKISALKKEFEEAFTNWFENN